tara:strand:- start:299 stop:478 length:180 start_codon:yes stop_codon:yes gene_type:complete
MKTGDLIRFSRTGVQGVVAKITNGFVYVLCGPDADGEHNGEVLAFPESYIKAVVVNEGR